VIYVAFVRECQRRNLKLNYAAHVTGHGWRKLMRLDEPFVYEITAPRPAPALFRFMQQAGPISEREMYATFNQGIGFAAYVDPKTADAVLAAAGQHCPLDPRDPAATVGGTLAAGLSGPRRLRYRPLRDRVLEVHLVTGDGRRVKGGGRVVKNVSGYDVCRLAVGSLGTLGVIAQVTLRCEPRPGEVEQVGHVVDAQEAAVARLDIGQV
jgi:hypothetical protein